MFPLIEKAQEGEANSIIPLWRWKKPCKTQQVLGMDLCGPKGNHSPLQHLFYGNSQLADVASAVTHPELLGSPAMKGKIKVKIFSGNSCKCKC